MKNFEELKDSGLKPMYFGLGMIQVNWSPTVRLNFYHPELLETTVDPISEFHDHRYDFASTVLKGSFNQKLVRFNTYSISMEATHELRFVSCQKDKPAPDIATKGTIDVYHSAHYAEGSSYWLGKDVFHSVNPSRPALTRIDRPAVAEKEFARVVNLIDKPQICPYATDLTEDDCWDVIQEVYYS